MPMVVMNEGVNESSLKRSRQHDLPTPESPMRSNLIYAGRVSGFGLAVEGSKDPARHVWREEQGNQAQRGNLQGNRNS
jgi:hypothetical protein